MHTWHLARAQAIARILEAEAAVARADALLERLAWQDARELPTRRALEAAKWLGLLGGR